MDPNIANITREEVDAAEEWFIKVLDCLQTRDWTSAEVNNLYREKPFLGWILRVIQGMTREPRIDGTAAHVVLSEFRVLNQIVNQDRSAVSQPPSHPLESKLILDKSLRDRLLQEFDSVRTLADEAHCPEPEKSIRQAERDIQKLTKQLDTLRAILTRGRQGAAEDSPDRTAHLQKAIDATEERLRAAKGRASRRRSKPS